MNKYRIISFCTIIPIFILSGCVDTSENDELIRKEAELLKDVFGEEHTIKELKYNESTKYIVYKDLSFSLEQKKTIFDYILNFDELYVTVNLYKNEKNNFSFVRNNDSQSLIEYRDLINKKYETIKNYEVKTKQDKELLERIALFNKMENDFINKILDNKINYNENTELLLYNNYINSYRHFLLEHELFIVEQYLIQKQSKIILTEKALNEHRDFIIYMTKQKIRSEKYGNDFTISSDLSEYTYVELIYALFNYNYKDTDEVNDFMVFLIKNIELKRKNIKNTNFYDNNDKFKDVINIFDNSDFSSLKKYYLNPSNKELNANYKKELNEKYTKTIDSFVLNDLDIVLINLYLIQNIDLHEETLKYDINVNDKKFLLN